MLSKKEIVERLDFFIGRFRENERPPILLYMRNRILSDNTWQQDKNFLAALSEWVIPPDETALV